MAIRTPRGFEKNRPYYQEISKGERLSVSAVPLTAWTGLSPTRIDEFHHDPIVLEPGTIVGIATGSPAAGDIMPVVWATGLDTTLHLMGHSDGASWGLTVASGSTNVGTVKPIGVAYQPIYSFMLQNTFTNYTRNDNMGVVTDYVIQVPATTAAENSLSPGDAVMPAYGTDAATLNHGMFGSMTDAYTNSSVAGRYRAYDASITNAAEMVIGRVLKTTVIGTSASAAGTELNDDLANFTISTAGAAEWKGLAKVTTVPGLGLAGDVTKGVPGWLLGARTNGTQYLALTILIRL